MSELVYKSYLFSTKEFMILCALTGIEEIDMFGESTRCEMDEEEVNQNVFQLYQKGILYCGEEDSWKVKPEIRSLFRDMRDAEKEMQIFKRGRNFHTSTTPKSATNGEYHTATGLECLFGYLKLSGEDSSAKELFTLIWNSQNDEE